MREIPMTTYKEYILQNFPDKDGKLETNKPKECRICWIKNGYPPFEELEKICNSTLKTIQNYSSRFNWKSIREKAEALKAKEELQNQEKKQKERLEKLDKVNEDMLKDLESQLNEINDQLNDTGLSEGQRAFLRKEKREIMEKIFKLQPNLLRTVNLPDKINDKQDHKHSGEIEIGVRMKKFLSPNNITKGQ